jgi:hypothetical protein
MSDIFKKFKSVFIVDDSSADASATGPVQQATPSQQAPAATPVATAQTQGSVTDKFVEILMSALEKNNQDGFDYFEYRQALKNLSAMPMDEATRFKSAYAMAQTMGVTPVKLADSAKFYLGVLANEQSKFNDAHTQQRAKLIGNREDDLKNLEAMVLQKTEQIKQLTQEIEDHRQKGDQIRSEISESTIKIENTKADFDATFSNVTANIEADIAKIKQYLQ